MCRALNLVLEKLELRATSPRAWHPGNSPFLLHSFSCFQDQVPLLVRGINPTPGASISAGYLTPTRAQGPPPPGPPRAAED